MSNTSLEARFADLEDKLLSGRPIGASTDIPFAIFVYDPRQELAIRGHVERLATRLRRNAGREAEVIDLGALFWECLAAHPDGPDGFFEIEKSSPDLAPVLQEAQIHLIGIPKPVPEPGPFEARLLEKLKRLDPERGVALLTRAGELFPVYRTSALLERLIGHRDLRVTTLLFYPGYLSGPTEPRFMGVCEPSPNYRVKIFG